MYQRTDPALTRKVLAHRVRGRCPSSQLRPPLGQTVDARPHPVAQPHHVCYIPTPLETVASHWQRRRAGLGGCTGRRIGVDLTRIAAASGACAYEAGAIGPGGLVRKLATEPKIRQSQLRPPAAALGWKHRQAIRQDATALAGFRVRRRRPDQPPCSVFACPWTFHLGPQPPGRSCPGRDRRPVVPAWSCAHEGGAATPSSAWPSSCSRLPRRA
jgi:hypothetical protein